MNNETKTKITVEFNAEKASAIRMYLSGKGMHVESELTKYLEILYDKHVPAQVRDFIKLKENSAPKKDAKAVSKSAKLSGQNCSEAAQTENII